MIPTEEIDTIYRIRELVEDKPGKLMLGELPAAVAKLKAQRDELAKLVESAYEDGVEDWLEHARHVEEYIPPFTHPWGESETRKRLTQIMKGGG